MTLHQKAGLLDRGIGRVRYSFFLRAVRQAVPFWPFLLPILLLIPGLNAFPYPSSSALYSDIAVTHYPNAIFLRRALLEWHTLPLWSPAILSGYPFAANPLSGFWYPPGWLALLFPLPLGFNLLVVAHLLWGGAGMYSLLRVENLGHPAALLGALAFEALPKLFAHYGAGHLTLLYAVPWTPWLLYVTLKPKRRRFFPAIILALIFLADVRWAAYAGAFWLAYAIAHSQYKKIGWDLHYLRSLVFQIFLAALLAAPLALPLWEYTQRSTRGQMSLTDVFSYSLPPARLLGLLFPDFGGFHEWMLYPGAVILLLWVIAILRKDLHSQGKFWIWVVPLSLMFSLGSNFPFLSILGHLPGFDLLRVPSRALFLTGIALAAGAAYALDGLLYRPESSSSPRLRLALAFLSAFALILTGGVWALTGSLPLNFVWGTVAILLTSIWLGLGLSKRVPVRIWFAGLILLCVFDLGGVDGSLFSPRPAASVLGEAESAARFLKSQEGLFRVYSPSYSLPQQSAALAGLQMADGVDPLQLENYSVFMEKASGVPQAGYSVTLPPFANGEPAQANSAYLPDPSLLGLLNVGFVLSAYDLPVDGLILRQRFGNLRLYQNLLVKPRAWVQPAESDLGSNVTPAMITLYSPNRIALQAEGPGLLVLSELAYPGWRVWIDGHPQEIQRVDGLLRGVPLESGLHDIVFAFCPLSLYAGLVLFGIGFLLLVGLWWKESHRQTGLAKDIFLETVDDDRKG